MRKFTRYAVVPMAIGSLSACADQMSSEPTGPQGRLELSVAPLTLPGINGASYEITVVNGASQTVWNESGLTSAAYGDGEGALTYIGACDADSPNHTVKLRLISLSDSSGPLASPGDYVNPCPTLDSCTVTATCIENADTLVEFNLAIMRSADQGFFDIAVNFEDVFCSGKIDCKQDILAVPGETGRRDALIGAFACTSGLNGGTTFLHIDYDNSGSTDFVTASVDGWSGTAYSVYKDKETLSGYSKGFVNIAVPVATSGATALRIKVSATEGAAKTNYQSYPVISGSEQVNGSCPSSYTAKVVGAGLTVAYGSGDVTAGMEHIDVSTLD